MVHLAARLLPLLALCVAGCVDELPDAAVGRGDVRAAIARGALKSPRPATVALASLDGAPPALAARFTGLFDRDAADREITVTDPKVARYLVRGYLAAVPDDGRTAVTYVYDIYDADRRRVDRVSDTLTVPGSSADGWAPIDDTVLASLAGRSADDLAVALSGTPEAQAGAPVVASTER